MTREKLLETAQKFYAIHKDCIINDIPVKEYLEIGLKALAQEPITTTAEEGGVMYYPQVEGVTPTVVSTRKQTPCEDAISRQAADRRL